jgi:hypothetical protein
MLSGNLLDRPRTVHGKEADLDFRRSAAIGFAPLPEFVVKWRERVATMLPRPRWIPADS